MSNQSDTVLSSPFIVLQNHSTCFGCPFAPHHQGVHKTVVTTTGTNHAVNYKDIVWKKNVEGMWLPCDCTLMMGAKGQPKHVIFNASRVRFRSDYV